MQITKLNLLFHIFASIQLHSQAYTFNSAIFNREWSVRTDPTGDQVTIVAAEKHLIYKWLNCDPDLVLILKSLEIGFPSCQVPLVLQYGRLRDLATLGLGNGKLLFWLEDHNAEKSCWRHYLVDVQTCLYDGYWVEGHGRMDAIVAYQDQFDALFVNGTVSVNSTAACVMRYNDKGVNVKNFTIPRGVNSTRYKFGSIKEKDPNSGFFYVEETNDGKSVVRLFNSSFGELGKQEYNHTVDAISTSHKSINICYIKEKQLNCKFMDSQLDSKGNVTVNVAGKINGIEMFNLADGAAVVLTVSRINETSFVDARYINVKEISKPVELEKYTCSDKLKVQHFELRDGVHCVATLCKDSDIIRTKCITPEKERGLIVLHDKTL